MTPYDFDLITIGAGSAGVRASRVSASYGAKTAVIEERELGGTCVNIGCIPKKFLVYAAHYREDFEDASGYGWSVTQKSFSWSRLIKNKNKEISRLNNIYRQILQKNSVRIINGKARLLDAHTVLVGKKKYTSQYILLATGSCPFIQNIPGKELVITSNEAFFLKKLPRNILIIGGGYIAVEFAGILNSLGVKVTQIYRAPAVLRGFDHDLGGSLAKEMTKKGIILRPKTLLEKVTKTPNGLLATFSNGKKIKTNQILCATGRRPRTSDLGLIETGIKMDNQGAIVVDKYSRTNIPNIYAIGDCTNRLMLTPVAIAEGRAVAKTLFRNHPTQPDYTNVPTCVFSQPNVGSVGLTEEEARKQYGFVDIYRSTFRALKHTLSGRDEQTMIKLIVDPKSDRVLGCHMVGPDAGEIIQGFAVALKCQATKSQFDATIGIHPTLAEEFVTQRKKSSGSSPP